jgi:AAA+ superfamily predicted ATPase
MSAVASPIGTWNLEMFPGDDPYLEALLRWFHRLLNWQIAVTRQTYGDLADDEYRGLYVPDSEVELLTTDFPQLPEDLRHLRQHLADERKEIEQFGLANAQRGAESPLFRLGRHFGLEQVDRDVLVLALAPELDLRYERLYAYIQDDVTRKRPTVDLALRLLVPDRAEQLNHRTIFNADSALLKNRLIEVFEDGQRHTVFVSRYIRLDDAIVAELLGQETIDPQLAPYATLTSPVSTLDTLILNRELVHMLRSGRQDQDGGFALALQGSYGSGRHSIAEAMAAEAGRPVLTIDVSRLIESDLRPDDAMRRVIRQGILRSATILWHGIDPVLHALEQSPWLPALLAAIDEYEGGSFLPLVQPWEARGALRRARYLRIALPAPTFSERERIWRLHLGEDAPRDETLTKLASTFKLSPGQIRDAVVMARSLKSFESAALLPEHLFAACRGQSSGKLTALAHKIETTYEWSDIVLPSDHMAQLHEICSQMRHRQTVLELWGFDRHLAMGKGLNCLFAGPSGTGKTMAAEIVAADLGLELYKVDLSTMVSKYIGETEKNLDRIFTAAQEANAILFFDEADAIFGKRSEVKDAHDRYANIEVGYLLQKMEEYDGVVILATNLRKNLDDAFIRRMHMTIEFPFPEEPDRFRIWEKVFPPEAPLDADADLRFLARQFKLTGGNIRNIALLAAYLAAEEAVPIGMSQIIRSMKREYQKLGKLVTESDFGSYLPLIRG